MVGGSEVGVGIIEIKPSFLKRLQSHMVNSVWKRIWLTNFCRTETLLQVQENPPYGIFQ